MAQNSSALVGQIDLLALVQASIQNINGEDCIIIPKSYNPSIFVTTAKNGSQKAYLDIVVKESPQNQFGNTHFVKAQVGKTTRDRLGLTKEDIAKYSPIIGNLKTFESNVSQQGQSSGFQGF